MQENHTFLEDRRGGAELARPRGESETGETGMGWLSVGLGLAQVVAPAGVARLMGVTNTDASLWAMRAAGVRELAAGLGMLRRPRSNAVLWMRLAGDVIGLALVVRQLSAKPRSKTRLALAAIAALGSTVVDAKAAIDSTRARRVPQIGTTGIHVKQAITIRATPGQVYGFWRDLENLPRFMSHLESVKVHNGRSLWSAKAPAGATVEWVAEVTADHPNSLISWRSLPGSTIPNHGSVRFASAPGNQGTEVHVELTYEPPGGAMGALVAKLFGEEPNQQIKSDLRRLKQVMETGEVLHSDASVHKGMHPAQPSGNAQGYPAKPLLAPASLTPKPKSADEIGPTSQRPLAISAPPKPSSHDAQRTAISDAPNDAIPFTHFTNQGSGTTRDDDAS